MSLPNPGMDFTPFDTLPAASLDDIVENIEALADGSGLDDGSIVPANLIAGTGTSWTWSSFTPTFTYAGGGSTGNAAITGLYKQTGETVDFFIRYVVGSTTTFAGLTALFFSYPVAPATPYTIAGAPIGKGIAFITGYYTLAAIGDSSTRAQLCAENASATYLSLSAVTSAVPAGWVNGSTWYIAGTYHV